MISQLHLHTLKVYGLQAFIHYNHYKRLWLTSSSIKLTPPHYVNPIIIPSQLLKRWYTNTNRAKQTLMRTLTRSSSYSCHPYINHMPFHALHNIDKKQIHSNLPWAFDIMKYMLINSENLLLYVFTMMRWPSWSKALD